MGRTQEQFNRVIERVKRRLATHPYVWVLPLENDYTITASAPMPHDIPRGCCAVMYGLRDGELFEYATMRSAQKGL